MTERIDHVAEAQKHIGWAHEQQEVDGEFDFSVRDNALIAQAEATLALVEQQRIGNLIEYLKVAEGVRGGMMHRDGGIVALDMLIRKGLGL